MKLTVFIRFSNADFASKYPGHAVTIVGYGVDRFQLGLQIMHIVLRHFL